MRFGVGERYGDGSMTMEAALVVSVWSGGGRGSALFCAALRRGCGGGGVER